MFKMYTNLQFIIASFMCMDNQFASDPNRFKTASEKPRLVHQVIKRQKYNVKIRFSIR